MHERLSATNAWFLQVPWQNIRNSAPLLRMSHPCFNFFVTMTAPTSCGRRHAHPQPNQQCSITRLFVKQSAKRNPTTSCGSKIVTNPWNLGETATCQTGSEMGFHQIRERWSCSGSSSSTYRSPRFRSMAANRAGNTSIYFLVGLGLMLQHFASWNFRSQVMLQFFQFVHDSRFHIGEHCWFLSLPYIENFHCLCEVISSL